MAFSTHCSKSAAAPRAAATRGVAAPRPPMPLHSVFCRAAFRSHAPGCPATVPRHGAALAAAPQSGEAAAAARPATAGRMTYRPQSFADLIIDVVRSVSAAIDAGENRLEVEFPPLAGSEDAYKRESDAFVDANVQLALAAAKQLAAAGRRVHIVLPDQGEYDRSYAMFRSSLDMLGGAVSMGHLRESGAGSGFSLSSIFGGSAPPSAAAAAAADVFLIANATCVELPNVRAYVDTSVRSKTAVLWNLELDTLRGDLGLLGLPPKEIHYAFLSQFLPAFFVRQRDYSKSVPVAPFIVNYSGALFREYPGPWQVMLRQDNGEYACVAEDRVRYNLGEVKEELMAAMGLNTEAEGSAMAFLRRGYKTATWFEEDEANEKSRKWRL